MLNKKIAVIGAGKMGGALIKGLLSAGLVARRNILACDKDKERLMPLSRKGLRTTGDIIEAVRWGEVIILSVKPKDIDCVLREISSASGLATSLKARLFISIAAGIRTGLIEKKLGNVSVIRVMPNTPLLIGEGMSAISTGRFSQSKHEHIARAIFGSVGSVMKFPEKSMDAITALSGSGPAYFFFLMEVLALAGKKMGISADDSLVLTLQTAKGAALLAEKSGIPPARLREMVTSRGGTTEAAFKILESKKVKEAIIKAVLQAEKRSRELSIN